MTDLHAGQRVVCVDAKPRPDVGNLPTLLTEGQIYTIDAIYETSAGVSVTLCEVAVPSTPPYRYKIGWCADRFRPVKETDISVFTAMLKTKKIKENA